MCACECSSMCRCVPVHAAFITHDLVVPGRGGISMLERWRDAPVLSAADVRDMQRNFHSLLQLADSYGGWPRIHPHIRDLLVSCHPRRRMCMYVRVSV